MSKDGATSYLLFRLSVHGDLVLSFSVIYGKGAWLIDPWPRGLTRVQRLVQLCRLHLEFIGKPMKFLFCEKVAAVTTGLPATNGKRAQICRIHGASPTFLR
jgi:hypothetical protein